MAGRCQNIPRLGNQYCYHIRNKYSKNHTCYYKTWCSNQKTISPSALWFPLWNIKWRRGCDVYHRVKHALCKNNSRIYSYLIGSKSVCILDFSIAKPIPKHVEPVCVLVVNLVYTTWHYQTTPTWDLFPSKSRGDHWWDTYLIGNKYKI
jgi:hypothetical protein